MASHSNTKPGRKQQQSAKYHQRRKRPRKLRVFNNDQPQHSEDLYEHDITSFVSNCAPGISFGTTNKTDSIAMNNHELSSRTPSKQKRHLPSLSFLATTTIAAEKKRLKMQEEKRKEAIAEMEARKILALNPNDSIEIMGEVPSKTIGEETSGGLPATNTVVETAASNVIMPPLLKHFLNKSIESE